MTALHFRDAQRTAALHIIDDTPLGDALVRLRGHVDDGALLTVDVADDDIDSLSDGEQLLYRFLAWLADQDYPPSAWELRSYLDEDCRVAVVRALVTAFKVEAGVPA